jgi:phosphohistidine phosphatase
MRALGIRFDVLLTSPLARAAETAAILCAAQGGAPAPRELGALAAGAAPAEALRALRPFARHDAVAIVGHEPGLSRLAALLLTGSPEGLALVLKKGGLVVLELRELAPRAATLRALLGPRQLRRLGR